MIHGERWTEPGGLVCCMRHINGCPPPPDESEFLSVDEFRARGLTTEQQDNTYAAGKRDPGLHREDGHTWSLVGTNDRRIVVREDTDGLYVGGVLVSDPGVIGALAELLGTLGREMAVDW